MVEAVQSLQRITREADLEGGAIGRAEQIHEPGIVRAEIPTVVR